MIRLLLLTLPRRGCSLGTSSLLFFMIEGLMGRSHLPFLFIGMEHLQLSNHSLAVNFIDAAQKINSDTDPLLANELGVNAYNESK
jgi:hypothetical protein